MQISTINQQKQTKHSTKTKFKTNQKASKQQQTLNKVNSQSASFPIRRTYINNQQQLKTLNQQNIQSNPKLKATKSNQSKQSTSNTKVTNSKLIIETSNYQNLTQPIQHQNTQNQRANFKINHQAQLTNTIQTHRKHTQNNKTIKPNKTSITRNLQSANSKFISTNYAPQNLPESKTKPNQQTQMSKYPNTNQSNQQEPQSNTKITKPRKIQIS